MSAASAAPPAPPLTAEPKAIRVTASWCANCGKPLMLLPGRWEHMNASSARFNITCDPSEVERHARIVAEMAAEAGRLTS